MNMRFIILGYFVFFCVFLSKAQNSDVSIIPNPVPKQPVNISPSVIPVKKNNLWGFCYQSADSILIKPCFNEFEAVQNVQHDSVSISYKVLARNRYGVVNARGELCADTVYDRLTRFYTSPDISQPLDFNSYFFATQNGLSGVINQDGKIMIPLKYDSVSQININWYDSTKTMYQLITKDSVYLSDANNTILLRTSRIKNQIPVFDMYFHGYWVVAVSSKGKLKEGLLNSNGKLIVKTAYDGINPVYDSGSDPAQKMKWTGTFRFSRGGARSKSGDYLLLNDNGKLSRAFRYIDENVPNDSLFIISNNKHHTVFYNSKINKIVKYNNSENYDVFPWTDGIGEKLYKVVQNRQSAIADKSGTVIMPFRSEDWYDITSNGPDDVMITALHLSKKDSSNVTGNDTLFYYNAKGVFLMQLPADNSYQFHVRSNTYWNSEAVINFKGDTLLSFKQGDFAALNTNYASQPKDTLTGFVYNLAAYPKPTAYLYKIANKAMLVDSGYISQGYDFPYSRLFTFASQMTPGKPLFNNKIYDKDLHIIFRGNTYLKTGYGYLLIGDSTSATFDENLKPITQCNCSFVWSNGYYSPISIRNKSNRYCMIDAAGKLKSNALFSEYKADYPFASFGRFKMNNHYYLVNNQLEVLCESNDTISSNEVQFWQKYISSQLYKYPLTLSKAKEIINGMDAVFTNPETYYRKRSGFFITIKGPDYFLYDSAGILHAIAPIPVKEKYYRSSYVDNACKGVYLKGDSLFCLKPGGIIKTKLDTTVYDKTDVDAERENIVVLKRKPAPDDPYSQHIRYDIFNWKGEMLHENIKFKQDLYPSKKLAVIRTEDKTYKLIDDTGNVLFESKNEITFYWDGSCNLWYVYYLNKKADSNTFHSNVISFINAAHKPVMLD